MASNPCFNKKTGTDCPNRTLGCHTTCEKWITYEKNRDEDYKKKEKQRQKNVADFEYLTRKYKKFRR